MKFRTLLTSSALILTGALSSSYANATLFDFDTTYNGTDFSLNAGSDVVRGTSIAASDSFNYTPTLTIVAIAARLAADLAEYTAGSLLPKKGH